MLVCRGRPGTDPATTRQVVYDSYSGGTTFEASTLIAASNMALANGTSLTVGPGGLFLFDPTQGVAGLAWSEAASITAVSEPGTIAILLAALSIWGAAIYRRFGFAAEWLWTVRAIEKVTSEAT